MYYKYNDINIYYKKYGNNNKTIVILPGWGDTRNTFLNLINNLKNKYTIYILDYPGFGKSSFPNYDLNIYDYAEIIYSWLKHLNINYINIIAHSFGGRIISLLNLKKDIIIDNIILIDVAGIKKRYNFKIFLYKFLKNLKIIIPKKYKNIYLKKLFKKFSSTDYKNLNNNMKNTFKNIVNTDMSKYYKLINTKTLIIWGENDLDTKLKDGIKIHKLIKNSELIVIKNGNHFVYLNYPTLINNIIISQFNN